MGKLGTASTLALVGLGAYMLMRKGPGSVVTASNGKKVRLGAKMNGASVQAGESVKVRTYRVITNQRAGMSYAPISEGAIGTELKIGPMPRAGTLTRNMVLDRATGLMMAEIA